MKYKYTMLLSPVSLSSMIAIMENAKVKLVAKVQVEIETDRNEEEEISDLEVKIGTRYGEYEFVGYEDLVKVIK